MLGECMSESFHNLDVYHLVANVEALVDFSVFIYLPKMCLVM